MSSTQKLAIEMAMRAWDAHLMYIDELIKSCGGGERMSKWTISRARLEKMREQGVPEDQLQNLINTGVAEPDDRTKRLLDLPEGARSEATNLFNQIDAFNQKWKEDVELRVAVWDQTKTRENPGRKSAE